MRYYLTPEGVVLAADVAGAYRDEAGRRVCACVRAVETAEDGQYMYRHGTVRVDGLSAYERLTRGLAHAFCPQLAAYEAGMAATAGGEMALSA